MADLSDKLSRPFFSLGAPVIDATGLTGLFDFTLNWTPDNLSAETAPGPSIFAALLEQLGLKLEASKSTLEVLVIDHVERIPREN